MCVCVHPVLLWKPQIKIRRRLSLSRGLTEFSLSVALCARILAPGKFIIVYMANNQKIHLCTPLCFFLLFVFYLFPIKRCEVSTGVLVRLYLSLRVCVCLRYKGCEKWLTERKRVWARTQNCCCRRRWRKAIKILLASPLRANDPAGLKFAAA